MVSGLSGGLAKKGAGELPHYKGSEVMSEAGHTRNGRVEMYC